MKKTKKKAKHRKSNAATRENKYAYVSKLMQAVPRRYHPEILETLAEIFRNADETIAGMDRTIKKRRSKKQKGQ